MRYDGVWSCHHVISLAYLCWRETRFATTDEGRLTKRREGGVQYERENKKEANGDIIDEEATVREEPSCSLSPAELTPPPRVAI